MAANVGHCGPDFRSPAFAARPLPDQSEAHHREVAIERVGEPDPCALHDCEACRIDRRKLEQVGAAKVGPGLIQIVQFARKDCYGARTEGGGFPRQGYVAVRVPIEEGVSITTGTDV